MTTADRGALLQLWDEGAPGETLRIDPTIHGNPALDVRASAIEPEGPARIILELGRAGLVTVEVDDDGDMSFALTLQGRRAASLMAMSRADHALVLLGALMGTSDGPN
jgi:hypothetical protein